MAHDSDNSGMMDIYHSLDDGRIVELRIGPRLDGDGAIWARNLTDVEKEIYLKLKGSGYSDKDIYNCLN
jgi:hypothetical protein